jgi:group II intron reverse transcriptase/maturase/CRISPR-associated endonuclease Cas1
VPNGQTTVFNTPAMLYRQQRSQTLLTKALMPNNIKTAIEALEDKTKQDNLGQKLEAQLFNGITQLHQNHYQPPPLFGQEIPKRNGKTRLLAVAPVYDRILQKAVALQLTPSIDAILDQRSFAYRKGKSRLQIKSDINQAVKQGYRWIYESDIKNFFDAIDREQLKKRLIALFGQDPIFDAVINWLAADLLHNGQRIPRPLGVPQGSPLSPLVSNFVLDDFDSDIEAKGFKLIRYADDFVILCKSEEEATLAAAEVNRSLQEIGLQINGEKSHIINIEQGFRFVGFMFQDEWGVDVSHQRNPQHTPLVDEADDDLSDWDDDGDDTLNEDNIPPWEEPSVSVSHDNDLKIDNTPPWELPNSAQTVTHHNAALATDNTPPWETPQDSNLSFDETPEGHNKDDEDEGHDHRSAAFGMMPEEGSFFTLAGESSMLSLSNGKLVVKQDEIVVQSISLTHLSGVLLFGNHHLTTPLIKACLAAQIPIHLASRMGNYEGAIWKRQPIDNSYKGWFKQMAYFDSSDSALYLAKLTVESRITNLLFILQRYNTRPEIRTLIQQITASKEKVSTCDNAQSLLGYEGNASKNLFASLAYLLPEWCAFTGRNRRPPKDPYNVLLSYGYTWLYAHVDAILTARGFLTWKGYYHQPSSGHAALASDILESYRHIIERTALTAVNNKMIKLEDFRIEDEQLRLSSDARKKYLSLLETYFLKPKNGLTIWQQIHAQARNLWQNIHHQAPYLPFVEK